MSLKILSPAEKKADELGLCVKLRFAPDVVIAVDRKGQTYQVITPLSRSVQRHRFTPDCADLCQQGSTLHRPHLCCLMNLFGCGCRLPRVRDGRLPSAIPVQLYFLAINENRSWLTLKRFLIHKLLSIAEILAN